MSYFPPTGSVVSFQSDPTKFVGTVSIVSHSPQSVATLQGTNPWIISNTSITAFQGGAWATSIVGVAQIGGSVLVHTANNSIITAALPASVSGVGIFNINVPSPSTIVYQAAGSVMAVGGTVGVTGTFNSSVTTYMGGVWATSMVGGPINVNSILGTYQEKNAVTASVFGIPTLFKIDETNSVLTAVSPQSPFPIRGSVATLQGTNPWITVPTSGSVLQGTSPWIINMPSPSVIVFQSAGSVMAIGGASSVMLLGVPTVVNLPTSSNASMIVLGGSGSIMTNTPATFGANNAWAQGNSVLAIGAFRNDNMSSITAADARYSPYLVGPVGENIVANAPINKWVSGWCSITTLAQPLVNLLPAGGASIFTFVTGVQITNWGSSSVLVALQSGATATLAIAMAQTNQTVILNYPNPLKSLSNTAIQVSIKSGPVASIFASAQGFISKFDT